MPNKREPAIIGTATYWMCTRCEQPKGAGAFGRDSRRTSRLKSHCKACCSELERLKRADPRFTAHVRAIARAALSRRRDSHNEYNRKRYRANREQLLKKSALYYETHKDRQRIGSRLKRAVKAGKIVVPVGCEACGNIARLHGHHDSYDIDRALVVTFMCARCHKWTHARRKDQQSGVWV